MYGHSSERWQHYRHRQRGNGWIVALVIVGLVVLTHGWILLVPLMLLAAFAFFGFFLPKLAWHMNNGDWQRGNWQSKNWHQSDWSCGGEKRKRHFEQWQSERWGTEKPKRDSRDDIEYV